MNEHEICEDVEFYQTANLFPEVQNKTMRDNDATETFEDVINVDTRPLQAPDGGPSQEKSVKCKFADGTTRFVARSQVPSHQEFPDDGTPFTLEVSMWMVTQWDMADREPKKIVKILDVVCLRQSAKAIQVRLPNGKEEWVPIKGVDGDSPVMADGDRGELWIEPWLAKMKGWTGATTRPGHLTPSSPTDDRNVSDDVRGGLGVHGAPDDDEIPF